MNDQQYPSMDQVIFTNTAYSDNISDNHGLENKINSYE